MDVKWRLSNEEVTIEIRTHAANYIYYNNTHKQLYIIVWKEWTGAGEYRHSIYYINTNKQLYIIVRKEWTGAGEYRHNIHSPYPIQNVK